jgi:hypothetical protein
LHTFEARAVCVENWLVVKQLKDCATRLHVSLDRATVARGVPADGAIVVELP